MKKKQVFMLLGVMGILVGAAMTTAFAGNSGIKVATEKVESVAISQVVEADGYIESEREKVYYAKVTAPVETFSFENGDYVEKGKKIVDYDIEDLEKEVTQARLQAEIEKNGYAGSAKQSKEMQQAYQEACNQDAYFQEAYKTALDQVNDLQLNIETVSDTVLSGKVKTICMVDALKGVE